MGKPLYNLPVAFSGGLVGFHFGVCIEGKFLSRLSSLKEDAGSNGEKVTSKSVSLGTFSDLLAVHAVFAALATTKTLFQKGAKFRCFNCFF